MSSFELFEGDSRAGLLSLPAGHLHTVITSIPYFGLRSYGTAPQVWADGWRGELGSEPTPDAFVAHIVEVFRAVWHALRADGTVWLNIGDSYSGEGHGSASDAGRTQHSPKQSTPGYHYAMQSNRQKGVGVPAKNLLLMPARVALALQADGWTVRSEIIWAKPNPMPESVTDRPTKAHEQIYLLTKGPRYFYDADAIRETATEAGTINSFGNKNAAARNVETLTGNMAPGVKYTQGSTRNARTVWTIASEPYPDAHFATFPTELPRRCILAGTSAKGCCSACGAPWRRVVERVAAGDTEAVQRPKHLQSSKSTLSLSGNGSQEWTERGSKTQTIGWEPTCTCNTGVVPCRVGDPFLGSGTTAAVARSLGRDAWGSELQAAYVPLIRARVAAATPWYAAQPQAADDVTDLPLFAAQGAA